MILYLIHTSPPGPVSLDRGNESASYICDGRWWPGRPEVSFIHHHHHCVLCVCAEQRGLMGVNGFSLQKTRRSSSKRHSPTTKHFIQNRGGDGRDLWSHLFPWFLCPVGRVGTFTQRVLCRLEERVMQVVVDPNVLLRIWFTWQCHFIPVWLCQFHTSENKGLLWNLIFSVLNPCFSTGWQHHALLNIYKYIKRSYFENNYANTLFTQLFSQSVLEIRVGNNFKCEHARMKKRRARLQLLCVFPSTWDRVHGNTKRE